ncbi:AraC family transcriptional regulator [uncultured Chitinophaga sp.]|jgi:AraC-type DNA-binding domain-containing proteins|uniref:helix-turn-helix transcriptional regulator n=1 Tax=uncultured Chitinophaga sp. TaxID=339340 RepID=UPI00261DE80A|nr:AraC family transcriptional regulator [uncultured Chitinophaga sp.]
MDILINPRQTEDPGKDVPVPAHLQQDLAPWGSWQYRQYAFGHILTQSFLHKHYRIYIYRFLIDTPVHLYFSCSLPTIALRHMLSGQVFADVAGFGKVLLEPLRYGLIYLPQGMNKAWFEAGTAESLHMELEYTWLEEMAESNHEIAGLMHRVTSASKEGKMLAPAPLDYNVQETLSSIRSSRETGGYLLMEFKTGILKILTSYGKAIKEQEYFEALPNVPDKELLISIHDTIRSSPRIQYTLARLAKQHHMHEKTLSRHFHRLFNISLSAYVQEQCMARAWFLISTTSRPLTEIANELGYTEISNFNRAFRRYYRMSPQALRNAKLSGNDPENVLPG